MHVPPNSVTVSQKFVDDMRANKARDTSNLPVKRPVRAHTLEVENEAITVTHKNDSHGKDSNEEFVPVHSARLYVPVYLRAETAD